jgi:hypothetical protein
MPGERPVSVPKKLILLELNEVPYRVIDAYCEERPESTLARVMAASRQYETITPDRIALDPWISWPTLHRGVNDEQHHILHLGQVLLDADERFPPVWRLLKHSGARVGVFGSLHSSNIPDDVREYCFYLPDYFDNEVFAHPKDLTAFQELNLRMTRQSARNVVRQIPLMSAARFIAAAPGLGLTLSTFAASISHLVREGFNKTLRIRRRAYQPLVTIDLFMRQLERTQPDFATFYTNHVAAAMHRYWGAAFPQDYGDDRLDKNWIRQYEGEIEFAMSKFDIMLKKVINFINTHPEYRLLVASSMGQAAIPAVQTYQFLSISDIDRFMAALGVPKGGWELRPAMVPCWSVVVHEPYRDQVVTQIQLIEIEGKSFKPDPRPVAPLSYDEGERGFFRFFVQFDNYTGPQTALLGGREVALEELGLGYVAHEDGVNCTAQHITAGSLWVYGARSVGSDGSRDKISTLDVAPSILEFFGLERPAYMRGSVSVRLDS